MSQYPITVRLRGDILDSLSYLASQRRISRQVLIEEILHNAVRDVVPPESMDRKEFLPTGVLELIQPRINALNQGDEISLKRLVGKAEWAKLPDPVRRNLGKDFKVLVNSGRFEGLQVGRKKSNNEQQYIKVQEAEGANE